jgi:hypothetical protein
MESDPLQQLRDVHLPADPAWWPPAIGWWVMALAAIALIVWLIWKAIAAYQKRAPIRAAKHLLGEAYEQYQAGAISAVDYLHRGNELLKRLLVRALGHEEMAPLSGIRWLHALDRLSGSTAFSDGPGSALGDARFEAAPQIDVETLHPQLQQVLGKVRP